MTPESVLTLFVCSSLFSAPKNSHLRIKAISARTENADMLVLYSETTLYTHTAGLGKKQQSKKPR